MYIEECQQTSLYSFLLPTFFFLHSANQSSPPPVGQVVVLAATNRLDDLDEAVIRRFEAKVYVGLPSLTARVHMLRTHMQHVPCALSEEEFHSVAQLTTDWSGSDIEVLCREAGETLVICIFVLRTLVYVQY